MEQIIFDTNDNIETKDRIKIALEQKIMNQEYTKFLHVNKNQDKSISIKAKSILAAKIKLTKRTSYIEVKPKFKDEFVNFERVHSSNNSLRIKIAGIDDVIALINQLSIIYMKVLSELGEESFGCCHRYVECSDALQCLHPDFMTSLACLYKKNLDRGKVFYGKNKNI